jgi:hypothetical protein
MNMTAKAVLLLIGLCAAVGSPAQGARQARKATAAPVATVESLRAEVASIRAANVAWRGIHWKTCLLDGLKEARATGKPALLWVFIDRPVDDARC